MIWNDVYLSSAAVWLGEKEDVQVAVDEGRYDPEECVADGFLSVRVAPDVTPPEMAIRAARRALERSDAAADSFGLVMHASVGFQGADHWSPAAYIQQNTVGGRGSAVEVKQASNGGFAALELAAGFVQGAHGPAAALITTGDRYDLPTYDRYRSDRGLPRGDAGTAMVLKRGGGVARLLSTVVIGYTDHEGLYRGTAPLGHVSGAEGWPIDIRARRTAYLDASGTDSRDITASLNSGEQETIWRTLDDAGLSAKEISRWVYPFAGRTVVNWDMRKRDFGIGKEHTVWSWGRTVGHVGAGDQTAGLTRILETGEVHPGDKVVLAGIGAGFYFGCAVLEITEQPEWSSTAD